MKNAELITALRWCQTRGCGKCVALLDNGSCKYGGAIKIKFAAADALEAANKTVIPHRNYERCHIYWCDCGWFLRNKDETPNYCPNCGARMKGEDK
jgi:hypothetical protein